MIVVNDHYVQYNKNHDVGYCGIVMIMVPTVLQDLTGKACQLQMSGWINYLQWWPWIRNIVAAQSSAGTVTAELQRSREASRIWWIMLQKNPKPGTQELFGRFGRHFLVLERVLRAAVLDFVITGWNSLHYMWYLCVMLDSSLSLSLSLCLSLCVYVSMSFCLAVFVSFCLCVLLFLYFSVFMSGCLGLSVFVSFCLSACRSLCLSVLSTPLFLYILQCM